MIEATGVIIILVTAVVSGSIVICLFMLAKRTLSGCAPSIGL